MSIIDDHYLELTDEDLFKINFIRCTLNQEDITKHFLVSHGLNQLYAQAIVDEYKDGHLTPDGYLYVLDMLDQSLRGVVMDKISSTSPSIDKKVSRTSPSK